MFKHLFIKEEKKRNIEPIAIGNSNLGFFMLVREREGKKASMSFILSKDGVKFTSEPHKAKIVNSGILGEDISKCHNFKLFCYEGESILTYTKVDSRGTRTFSAISKNLKKWKIINIISGIHDPAVFIPELYPKTKSAIYFGSRRIKVATSKNLKKWKTAEPYRVPHWNFFENTPFRIIGAYPTNEGTAVFFEAQIIADILKDVGLRDEKVGEEWYVKIGAALFSKNDPEKLVWQTELPLVELPISVGRGISIIGIVPVKVKQGIHFRFYVLTDENKIGFFEFSDKVMNDHQNRKPAALFRSDKNPILKPTEHDWEKEGAFNPAALHIDDKVHLFYRAVGNDGWSRVGYASSKDGVHFDERLPDPIYTLHQQFGIDKDPEKDGKNFGLFHSGGSWGGCEDPKLTRIGDRIYMTYVAHTGSWPTRTAITSISVDDFLKKRWHWTKPMLMSAPNVGSKSVVILPEKIDDKFVIFHRVWPDIVIDRVSKLEFGEGKQWLKNESLIRPRRSFWDSQKLSVGATPIKTKEGWLTIYNAVDKRDSSKYKIGAMLLDLLDPSKVIARTRKPILTPDEWYENDGKPGVVYPGGAVEIDGKLHIYYGGGDKVSCVAVIPTLELLWHLLNDKQPECKLLPVVF